MSPNSDSLWVAICVKNRAGWSPKRYLVESRHRMSPILMRRRDFLGPDG